MAIVRIKERWAPGASWDSKPPAILGQGWTGVGHVCLAQPVASALLLSCPLFHGLPGLCITSLGGFSRCPLSFWLSPDSLITQASVQPLPHDTDQGCAKCSPMLSRLPSAPCLAAPGHLHFREYLGSRLCSGNPGCSPSCWIAVPHTFTLCSGLTNQGLQDCGSMCGSVCRRSGV